MAGGETFADTSVLYAAVDARDAYHPDAASLLRQLSAGQADDSNE